MATAYCQKCDGYVSSRAETCPNCGSPYLDPLIFSDYRYKTSTPSCFLCRFIIKRVGYFRSSIKDDPELFEAHLAAGQYWCLKRNLWTHKNYTCPNFYRPLKEQVFLEERH